MLIVITVFAVVFAIIGLTIPSSIISISCNDPEIIDAGSRAFRVVNIFFSTFGFVITSTDLLQVFGKGIAARLLPMSKQDFFLIPAIIFLQKIFELNEDHFSRTVASYFALFVAAFLSVAIFKKLKSQSRELSLRERQPVIIRISPVHDHLL
ncbi:MULTISPECIES: hypothetical protein [Mesotoga]|uniref:hypothetical protein n=1 Tax=Mesotoga TaxID=1184396 RepID=UPI00058739DC|nr:MULTISPECIES: hypothetical protein [Mesotoga]MCP5457646.1 hypothetical protein [Thermotogota bacterium]MCP5461325.1 hypothetical protein [Thermotogota bacterium]MDD3461662.1 hypothetical protein [Mesotoga sp.]HNQ70472.1 hypothetical protein [Mesotoga prima]HNS76220.1 hypothetical protein [Mesotoga prima]